MESSKRSGRRGAIVRSVVWRLAVEVVHLRSPKPRTQATEYLLGRMPPLFVFRTHAQVICHTSSIHRSFVLSVMLSTKKRLWCSLLQWLFWAGTRSKRRSLGPLSWFPVQGCAQKKLLMISFSESEQGKSATAPGDISGLLLVSLATRWHNQVLGQKHRSPLPGFWILD